MTSLVENLSALQTDAKRVLCVCTAGMLRSPTTANVLYQEFGFNTRSAGIEAEVALIPVTHLLLVWADEIVVMESWQKYKIMQLMEVHGLDVNATPIRVLTVPDDYSWNDPTLRTLIKNAYIAVSGLGSKEQ